MQNKMLPEKEVELLKGIIENVKELAKVNSSHEPNFDEANDLYLVHSVIYLRGLKDFITNAMILEELLNETEEHFLAVITEEGKLTLEDVKEEVMMSLALEMVMRR